MPGVPHLARNSTVSTLDILCPRALNRPPTLASGHGLLPFSAARPPPWSEYMNKADLVERAAAAAGITKSQAGTAIDACVEGITASLKKGDRGTLVGFGTFSTSSRKARTGRNPQTGKPIKIAAKRVAKFSAGAELKKSVNKR